MSGRKLRITAITIVAGAAAGAGLVLLLRNQISRHRRDLFSPHSVRRLAALGYMNREEATVDNITLLRDFIAWEPRKLLRDRARSIMARMETDAASAGLRTGPEAA